MIVNEELLKKHRQQMLEYQFNQNQKNFSAQQNIFRPLNIFEEIEDSGTAPLTRDEKCVVKIHYTHVPPSMIILNHLNNQYQQMQQNIISANINSNPHQPFLVQNNNNQPQQPF